MKGETFRWRGQRRMKNARGVVRPKRVERMPNVHVADETHTKVARAANSMGLTMGRLIEYLIRDVPAVPVKRRVAA